MPGLRVLQYVHAGSVLSASLLLGSVIFLTPLSAGAFDWQDAMSENYGLEINGFVEGRAGWRFKDDLNEKNTSIAEGRLQVDAGYYAGSTAFKLKGGVVYDEVLEQDVAYLREANITLIPADNIDLKIGRQILTWGTGDLLFINDLFPKDWQSFFIGRDDEFLKSPADAVKASLFLDAFNLDIIYIPLFQKSEFVDGERLSYYNPFLGDFAGTNAVMTIDEPNRYFNEDELAARISKNIAGTELALYWYYGYWKEPEGTDLLSGRAYFPELSVYGGSARASIWDGIGNIEAGYYDSRANRDGDDWAGRNSEVRFSAGYSRELGQDFTGGIQYYLEWMEEYGNYETVLPDFMPKRDEYRHLVTARLTKLLFRQNLTLSLFVYYSPSDEDGYVRPKVKYKLDDHWQIDGGANLFWGNDDHTFWSRFQGNNNAYIGVRYSF